MENKLAADVQERIKADAKHYADVHWGDPAKFTTPNQAIHHGNCEEDYIAGAIAEENVAQAISEILPELKDTIEWMWKHMKEADGQTLLQVDHFNRPANALHIIDLAIQQWKDGKDIKQWQPIETAPKDGTTIEITYDREGKETCLARWSDNPICMLGSRCGSFPPGWATPSESGTDSNLPLDPPLMWREWKEGEEPQVELSCMVCGTKFMGPEPEMCCSGRDCGCMGLPIDPIVCSEECYNKGLPNTNPPK